MGKEPVQRRPMTQLEKARATALLFVFVQPLVQVLAARATYEGPTITDREGAALARFCRLYGAQLTARGDGKLVPAEPSPPAAEMDHG